MRPPRYLQILGTGVLLGGLMIIAPASEMPAPVALGADGKLVYQAAAAGDRIQDFSHAGYGGGGMVLPVVPARVEVRPADGDDGARIQAALDHVGATAPDAAGFRGAVWLAPGHYQIEGTIRMRSSGVVLRGSGPGEDGTVLEATGCGRRTLIEVGPGDATSRFGPTVEVVEESVPAGTTRFRLADAGGFAPGAAVSITRPCTKPWIDLLGMGDAPGRLGYGWKPGSRELVWDRTIRAVEGNTITLDAPVTMALEKRFGGATVRPVLDDGRIRQGGIENLRCVSAVDDANPLDEDHAWSAVGIDEARDCWVTDVTASRFAGATFWIAPRASRVTVQDCAVLDPVSECAGFRRLGFHCRGQQILFLRDRSKNGLQDFTTGNRTAGPVVFLDCDARGSSGFSGAMGTWSCGLLFDGVRIEGGGLRLDNLETFNQGVGWAAAHSLLWQCEASTIICRSPPGAPNRAVGVWGQLRGDGLWSATHQFVTPKSLYRAQLGERLGTAALAALERRRYNRPTGSLPLGPDPSDGKTAEDDPLRLVNGILFIGDKRLSGKQVETAWWRGSIDPNPPDENGLALTRFVPPGLGLVETPESVAAAMRRNGQVFFRHHHGLWYDRRRDDHQMVRRPDGEAWPPFYDQPFARTGQGRAWDGLSCYDLTKFNPWYFERLREFAHLARRDGLVLIDEMYFQHNLIESGAHWVDSPWRPVNNINHTEFTEPPPFDGDTIRMADEFYDLTRADRRSLHRGFIRHHLDVLGSESNVIHTLGAENSGPAEFMRFWLDVVAEWEQETGRHPLIALSAPKDVQDAILADPVRAKVVDVIDLTYWFRTDQGEEFAPPGGRSLSPRQHLRTWKSGPPSAASIRAMAEDYRHRFPGKVVISGLPEAGDVQP